MAFAKMAKQYGLISLEDLPRVIKSDWRDANPFIVKLWYDLSQPPKRQSGNPASPLVFQARRLSSRSRASGC